MAGVPGDLVCRVDASGIVSRADGGEGLPWAAAELPGRSFAGILPDDAARALPAALAAAAGGHTGTVHFTTLDGAEPRSFEIRVTRAGRDLLLVVRDVSAERRTYLEAAAGKAFLRQIIDLDPSLIFAKDREGRFTLANRAVAAVYGTTPSGLVGKTDADFNDNRDEVERFRRDDLHVMDTLEPKQIPEEPVTSSDGATRWFQTIKIPIASPGGRANAILGVAADITARKETELRLLRQQAALCELALAQDADLPSALKRILTTAAATLSVDRAGFWLLSNDRSTLRADTVFDRGALLSDAPRQFEAHDHPAYFAAMHSDRSIAAGDARHDPVTRSLAASYLEPEGIHAMLDVPIRWHGELIGVVCHEHRGGVRAFTLEERDFAASIADFVALALSAANRRSLEDQLRQAQKMEAVGLLAGGIAHDFNNLLNIIAGYAGLASAKLETTHPAAPHVRTISDACLRAGELVRKILTFSRGQVLKIEPVEFGALLVDFSALLKRILGEDIELKVERPGTPLYVRADRTQLEQILLNLCTNARQAMPRGGSLTLAAREVQLDGAAVAGQPGLPAGGYLHLKVEDTGHGIDPSTMERLWEPFFTTKSDGTGLGLSMVYGIVRQHGGLVGADSRVGHGSTFHVYLPLDRTVGPAVGAVAPAVLAGRGETVLVVEDEALIRDLLKETLGDLGYRVLLAPDGAEAVTIFEKMREAIDLVILDVVMPRLSGPEALSRMVALRPDVKALFVSGHAPESAHLAQVLESSGRAFLAKPFVLEALAAKVREVLDAG
ncbi:MAG TPA: PAS domain-containing protein [Candidatus Polarisedimenticolaceae bacterium]|nr:PAS domain-containing protein [Candidatus Polarisedimenticolaceae bacterium]